MDAVQEKMFQAEQRMAGVRLLVIAAGFIYPLFMEKAGTTPWLAYITLAIAWIYGIYIFAGQPYRKYPLLLSSYFTTISDALLVTVWLYATGGFYSPFYVLIYPAMMSVAIRYSVTEIAIAALIYAGSYLWLIAASGELSGHTTEIIVRVTYIFLTAALGTQISREIMDQMRTKTALEAQLVTGAMHSRLAAIIEDTDEAVVSTDLNGIITSWNRGAEDLYLYRAKEMVGSSVFQLAPADRVAEMREIIERIRMGDRVRNMETVRLRRDGTPVMISVSYSPLRDIQGQIIGKSSIARNITEIKRAEQEIQKLNAELEQRVILRTRELNEAVRLLEQSNQDLEQFAYVASHDLQEPLRMVSSFVQLLKERYNDQLDDKGKQYIYFAVDAAQRMKAMIDGLLALSRVDKQGLPFAAVSLDAILREVKQNLNLMIQENRASFVIPAPLPTIVGDRAQLVQLFQNLISNAVKFKKVDEPPVITITAEASDKAWVLSVADNGIGIEPEYTDRIFAIFQKLHPAVQYPGTGIGLAVAKKIVERHGGFIGVKSHLGEGATFVISLPQDPKPAV